jgi:phage baseplate assembly protein W
LAYTFADSDIFGRELSNGQAVEHIDAEAIKNALTLFLTSKKGDFLMQPEMGGPLDRVLFKSLDGNVSALVIFTIKNALINYFSPAIKIIDIQFDPDYTSRIWQITIYYTSNLSTTIEQVEVYTKDILNITQQLTQNILYTGESLRMFCLMQKSSMGSELLALDTTDNKWHWGKFLFENFTTEDAFFTDILAICNS